MDSLNHSLYASFFFFFMGTLGKNTATSPEGDSLPEYQCHLPPDRLYQAAATKERSAFGCLNWLPVCLFTEIKCNINMRMGLSRPICGLWPTYKMTGGTRMVTGSTDSVCHEEHHLIWLHWGNSKEISSEIAEQISQPGL